MACDFPGTHFDSEKTEGQFCASACASNPRCTHFAWTGFEGGTCWFKSGQAKKVSILPTLYKQLFHAHLSGAQGLLLSLLVNCLY